MVEQLPHCDLLRLSLSIDDLSCQLDKSFYGRLFFVCLYACKRSRLGAVTAEHETFLSSETSISPDAVTAVPGVSNGR